MDIKELQQEALQLLRNLIQTPSFSGEEDQTAQLLEEWFVKHKIPHKRHLNNVSYLLDKWLHSRSIWWIFYSNG